MYKMIVFFGPSGSGKSELVKVLGDFYRRDYHRVVSCTSRPPRDGERDGIDYNFLKETPIKPDDFIFMEHTLFNGWLYGTRWQDLVEDKLNVGVFNPTGIRTLLKLQDENKIELKIYYLQTSDKERLMRQLQREDNPDIDEIIRRYQADKKDFLWTGDIPHTVLLNETKHDFSRILDMFREGEVL